VYIRYSSEDLSSHQSYDFGEWVDVKYTYYKKAMFPTLSVPEWFKNSKFNNYFGELLLANILNGNTKGLNAALDDLYNVLFSTEYEDACKKIDAVTGSVKIPSRVIEDFGLTEIVGDTSVKLGKAELALIKTSFNILKATIEYAQSYNLNSDLSFLKFDWADKDAAMKVFEKYLRYDASIDPLANGFMSQRSPEKMAASKEHFASAVSDLIAAYDDILKNTTDYPTALTDVLNEYKVLREGAVQLKAAIADGGKFYIPETDGLPASWPASGSLYIDIGKLFDASNFALKNFIKNTNGKTRVYLLQLKYDQETDEEYFVTTKTLMNEEGENIIVLESSELDSNSIKTILENADEISDNNSLGLQIDLSSLQTVFSGFDFTEFSPAILKSSSGKYYFAQELGVLPGLYVYNFYHDGEIADGIKSLIAGK